MSDSQYKVLVSQSSRACSCARESFEIQFQLNSNNIKASRVWQVLRKGLTEDVCLCKKGPNLQSSNDATQTRSNVSIYTDTLAKLKIGTPQHSGQGGEIR